MKIRVLSSRGALSPFDWENIPNFSVLTGLNGVGKTQLLEAIARASKEARNGAVALEDAPPGRAIHRTSEWAFQGKESSGFFPSESAQTAWIMYGQGKTLAARVASAVKRIETDRGVQPGKLSREEFLKELKFTDFYDGAELLDAQIAEIFAEYERKRVMAKLADKPHQPGAPPWELLNAILENAGVPYSVAPPNFLDLKSKYSVQLTHKTLGGVVGLNALSAGEKVLICTLLWHYGLDVAPAGRPRLLLLDEPDAHLHPSMVAQFLRLLLDVFVAQHGSRIILTTHSPTTVALAPEDSVFLMDPPSPSPTARIRKVTRDEAIGRLTAGVPTLRLHIGNQRQAFVESEHDAAVYQALSMTLGHLLDPLIALSFVPAGKGSRESGGRGRVQDLVQSLRSAGVDTVLGLVDWDEASSTLQHVDVLGAGERKEIENFVLDPLAIGLLLWREQAIHPDSLGLPSTARITNLAGLAPKDYQAIADAILKRIEPRLSGEERARTGNQKIKLVGGHELELPLWFLRLNGHRLHDIVVDEFPKLRRFAHSDADLMLAVIRGVFNEQPNLVPRPILEALIKLQRRSG